ncbi:MAG: hypothetical protein P4L27_04625 [Ignavibacteriaceae bacterium]|nr:hypothetical protein [Ignavibacteriaceae bacterium]
MKLLIYLFLLFTITDLFPQSDSTDVEYDLFTVKLDNNLLQVFSNDSTELFNQKFQNPVFTTADLDSDQVDEYIIIDYKILDQKKDYTIYVYNTIDTFYCVDSIKSGFYEPYVYYSEEVRSNVIIAGVPSFNELNIGKTDISLPFNVWKYGDYGIVNINDQIYDLFQSENEGVIDFLDDFFDSNPKNCTSSMMVNNVIAAGYSNYKHAGELSVANQFLLKYYLCTDIDTFKKNIDKLL